MDATPAEMDVAMLDGGASRTSERLRGYRRALAGGAVMLAFVTLAIVIGGASKLARHSGHQRPVSLGPRSSRATYVYISFHGNHRRSPTQDQGVNQIYRYTLRPAAMAASGVPPDAPVHVLQHVLGEHTRLLRGMLLEPATGDLFVANAYYDDSKVLRFGPCEPNGSRAFVERVAPRVQDSRLVHPYGLALLDETLYATTQDTGSIVGVRVAERDRALEHSLEFGRAGQKVAFRGLASFDGCLYAAEEGSSSVLKLCDGVLRASIHIRKPIGVVVDERRRLLFVGSRWRKRPRVAAFDLDSHTTVQEYTLGRMTHPAGLAVDGDRLYVAEQDALQVLEFDIPSGQFTRVVVDDLPDDPEGMLLTTC